MSVLSTRKFVMSIEEQRIIDSCPPFKLASKDDRQQLLAKLPDSVTGGQDHLEKIAEKLHGHGLVSDNQRNNLTDFKTLMDNVKQSILDHPDFELMFKRILDVFIDPELGDALNRIGAQLFFEWRQPSPDELFSGTEKQRDDRAAAKLSSTRRTSTSDGHLGDPYSVQPIVQSRQSEISSPHDEQHEQLIVSGKANKHKNTPKHCDMPLEEPDAVDDDADDKETPNGVSQGEDIRQHNQERQKLREAENMYNNGYKKLLGCQNCDEKNKEIHELQKTVSTLQNKIQELVEAARSRVLKSQESVEERERKLDEEIREFREYKRKEDKKIDQDREELKAKAKKDLKEIERRESEVLAREKELAKKEIQLQSRELQRLSEQNNV